MTTQPDDVAELLKEIHHDLSISRAKLNEAIKMFYALNLPSTAEATCPHCKGKFAGPRSLADHIYVSHGGPRPPDDPPAELIAE